MSVKDSMLVLLCERDRHGYELHALFEARTGGAWPLNIGQVYSTLERLERDELIERTGDGDERQVRYAVTDAGREAAQAWWSTPAKPSSMSRDDMVLKVALAASGHEHNVTEVIHIQRAATMASLQDLTRAKRTSEQGDDAWQLVVDAMIFRAEAEVRWLDHTESTLARRTLGNKPKVSHDHPSRFGASAGAQPKSVPSKKEEGR